MSSKGKVPRTGRVSNSTGIQSRSPGSEKKKRGLTVYPATITFSLPLHFLVPLGLHTVKEH